MFNVSLEKNNESALYCYKKIKEYISTRFYDCGKKILLRIGYIADRVSIN
jgi:hypothetical protein